MVFRTIKGEIRYVSQTLQCTFIFVINDMDKDNRRQDKHTSSVIKKGKFVIKKREKIYVPE